MHGSNVNMYNQLFKYKLYASSKKIIIWPLNKDKEARVISAH